MQFNLSLSASQLFRSVRLFEHLTPEELTAVVRAAQPRRLAAGELLFAKSGPGDGMFIVERGELSVTTEGAHGEHLTLAYLGNGAFVGEMSLLDGAPRSASVEAVAARAKPRSATRRANSSCRCGGSDVALLEHTSDAA